MNKYLIVYLEPTDYYIKVVKHGWNGEEEDIERYNETKTTIVEANNIEEAYHKCEYEVINIIKLND